MSKKTGRPTEEDGHIRSNISLCVSIFDYLQKGQYLSLNIDGVSNASKFIEKAIRELVKKRENQKTIYGNIVESAPQSGDNKPICYIEKLDVSPMFPTLNLYRRAGSRRH